MDLLANIERLSGGLHSRSPMPKKMSRVIALKRAEAGDVKALPALGEAGVWLGP